MTGNDLEWVWRSLLLFETFVITISLHVWTTMCLHMNYKANMADNLTFIVKSDKAIKVTGSHVHFKRGIILETVLNWDVVTTLCIAYLIAPTAMIVGVLQGHSSIAIIFKLDIS